MTLLEKIDVPPSWSKKDVNKWADYIELLCLKNKDHYLTISDVIDFYTDERPEDLDRGSPDHSAKYDKLHSKISDYFKMLEFRQKTLNKYYPFIIKDESITLLHNLNNENLFYIFLLFCSHTSFVKSHTYELTHAFEDISSSALHAVSSPLAQTHVFGTSRTYGDRLLYSGNLKNRLSILSKNLNSLTSKPLDRTTAYDVPGGDAGLDLVSYITLDEEPFIPVAFGQCACSYDKWEEKQFSIHYDKWRSLFNNLAPYLQFTFVPFYYRYTNGEFENPIIIHTCLIDRHRMFQILKSNSNVLSSFTSHSIYQWLISSLRDDLLVEIDIRTRKPIRVVKNFRG